MDISIQTQLSAAESLDCFICFIDFKQIDHSLQAIQISNRAAIKSIIERGDLKEKAGETLILPMTNIPTIDRLVLIAMDSSNTPDSLFKLMRAIEMVLATLPIARVAITIDPLERFNMIEQASLLISQACVVSSYQSTQFKQQPADQSIELKSVILLSKNQQKALNHSIQYGKAMGSGINYAKCLADLPANRCTPSYLSDQAIALSEKHDNLSVDILDEEALEQLGMHSFLAVSQGSSEPGRFIILNYQGGKKDQAPYVLLGKGVTFDSGGISLKPASKMDEMKFDMCGAASVMGVMSAIADIKPAINIIGVIVSAENMPSGEAVKPGDIITSLSGKTIEILNTDAEGRLLLCDGLTYIERFKPAAVIDIATLTGACVVALGHHRSGLISNNEALQEQLLLLGDQINDRVWPMPMGEAYQEQLKSPWADLANIGGPSAGMITAGCFLSKFAEAYPWAHLDIAGTAWKSAKNKGATGRPVALLTYYLLNQAHLIA
ncbi:MAG: leucyl aminopeptidase [Endozoicomonadaceae bacterium]|nr:leucyl aminopeptidase [Endozoicomonadaceae bacterium]